MKYQYKNHGVCSQAVEFEIEDGIIRNIVFYGGCNGNTKGISALCEGMKAQDVVDRLKGIRCGFKNTSCPDQLASAVEDALSKQ